jgi:hypothetical protein
MGRKVGHLPESEIDYILEKSHEILFVSEILYSWSIFLSKMAVLTFYRRLFHVSSIRVPIIILMVCSGIWITIRTFMTIFHCMPVQAYWDKSIDGKCLNNIGKYYLGTDLTHCLMDFIILALPLFEVVRMKLVLGQKIAVIAIFSLGSLVGVASIFQIVEAQKYTANSREFPFEFSLAMVWANVETHLAVFTSTPIPNNPLVLCANKSRRPRSPPSHLPQIHPRPPRQHNIPQRPQPQRKQHQHLHQQHRPPTIPKPPRHGHRGPTCVLLPGL